MDLEPKKRQMLKRILATAWNRCITNGYENRQINSERGLQVVFCAEIMRQFEEAGLLQRRLFVEAPFKLAHEEGTRRIIPDIIICNRNEIVAAIEIKYTPKGRARYEHDLNKLFSFVEFRGNKDLTLSNDRYRGPAKNKTYSFSKDVVFTWAGIYKAGDSNACVEGMESYVSEHYPDFKSTFLSLHAETYADASPKVFSNPKRLKLIERSEK